MTIRQADGKVYQLRGPNKLSRNSSKFWDFGDIKYVNFDEYGDLVILDPVRVIPQDIPIKEEQEQYIGSNLNNLGSSLEDNYLDDAFDKEFEVDKYEPTSNNSTIPEDDIGLEGGSPIIYKYIDPIEGPSEKQIYAQIIDQNEKNRVYIISKNESIQLDNIIICEWERTNWKIISLTVKDNKKFVLSVRI